jgi:hypothetical protein
LSHFRSGLSGSPGLGRTILSFFDPEAFMTRLNHCSKFESKPNKLGNEFGAGKLSQEQN